MKANPKSFTQVLLKRYFLRFHMSMILASTIAAGVQVDHWLRGPLHSMAWRYGLAVLGAYAVFFLLVRLWIWYAAGIAPDLPDLGSSGSGRSSSGGGLLDIPSLGRGSGGAAAEPVFPGFGGGDAGGAGASSSWGVAGDLPSVPSDGGGGGGGFSFDVDLDDGFWILIVLALLIAIICGAGGYLIYMAPEILPEVALDAAFAAGLIQAAKKMERRNWAGTLFAKTCVPLVVVLVLAAAAGFFIQAQCPQAGRVSEALNCSALPR